MRAAILLGAAALAGCGTGGGLDPFASSAPAWGDSYNCARWVTGELGYLTTESGGESFRAEKSLGTSERGLHTIGVLRVSVDNQRLRVRAERYAEETARRPGAFPPGGLPQPPTPGPQPADTTRRGTPRRELQRLEPGPVVQFDAQTVVRRCASGGPG